MINVVYPYIPSKWGEELKYSLRSLDKNLKTPYRVIIYGSECPEWLDTNEVEFILSKCDKAPQFDIGCTQYNQGLIYKSIIDRGDIDEFVFFNDDIYLIKETDDLSVVYVGANNTYKRTEFASGNTWKMALHNTRASMRDQGYTSFNYETHLPYPIKTAELAKLDKVLSGEYLLATTYYNKLITHECCSYKEVTVMSYSENNVSHKLKEFDDSSKMWFNHNDSGLRVAETILPRLFPTRSKFECS